MRINITDIEDAITYQDVMKLNKIFGKAEQTINAGNKVVLERRYRNSPPDPDNVFTSLRQLNEYKTKVFEALELLETRKKELFVKLREDFPDGV